MNCDFIMAGAVDVERLWSEGKYIMAEDHCKSMDPMTFEAQIFLKMKTHFWDLALIRGVITLFKTKAVTNARMLTTTTSTSRLNTMMTTTTTSEQ